MTQEEFNAWLAAQGGPSAVQHSKTNKTIPNPAKQDPASKIDDTIPPTITVSTLTWVNKRTGAKLSLIPDGPGQYTIDEQIDAGPVPADPAKPPTERVDPADPAKRQVWNPEANGGKGAWEAGGPVARDASKPPTERVNPSDPKRRQRWDPDANGGKGEWVDAGDIAKPSDPSKPPQERPNPEDPTRRQRWDPDANGGAGAWVDSGAIAKEPEKPVTRTDKEGRTFVQVKDPTTGELSEKEVPRTEINNAPPVSATGWTPDLTKPAYGLQERYAELARRQSLAPTAPDYLTGSQAKSLYDQDKAVAETELARVQSITSVQSGIHGQDITQRGQDQGVVNQRLTSGHNATTSALAAAQAGHHGGAATMQLLDMYYRQAERYGGLKDIPREPLAPTQARINALDPLAPGGLPGGAPAAPVQPTPYDPAPTRSLAPPLPAGIPDTGPLPMIPSAPSATPLPVGLTNIPPAAGLPVPAGVGLPDSSAGLTGGPLAGPSVQPVMAGFDPRQIAGLDPQAALRQQIIRQHFAGLMGGGF